MAQEAEPPHLLQGCNIRCAYRHNPETQVDASPARHVASSHAQLHALSVADGKVVWTTPFASTATTALFASINPRQRLSCSAQERWPTAAFLIRRSSAESPRPAANDPPRLPLRAFSPTATQLV